MLKQLDSSWKMGYLLCFLIRRDYFAEVLRTKYIKVQTDFKNLIKVGFIWHFEKKQLIESLKRVKIMLSWKSNNLREVMNHFDVYDALIWSTERISEKGDEILDEIKQLLLNYEKQFRDGFPTFCFKHWYLSKTRESPNNLS